ncbi:hypothetical protein BGZ95_009761 [Linnemannia exigua]|uniref:Uncharacterized protein n=1 Tax=Linnemannia exigua TaxID=604196 RepID=A0AAD4DM75_9FUNG|nr:hypothetical protein BGZ95_009761 [Linnemannia exigua]
MLAIIVLIGIGVIVLGLIIFVSYLGYKHWKSPPPDPTFNPALTNTTPQNHGDNIEIMVDGSAATAIRLLFADWQKARQLKKDAKAEQQRLDSDPNAVPTYAAHVDINQRVHPSVVTSMPYPTLQDDPFNNHIHGGVPPPSYASNTQSPQGSPAVPNYVVVPIPSEPATRS